MGNEQHVVTSNDAQDCAANLRDEKRKGCNHDYSAKRHGYNKDFNLETLMFTISKSSNKVGDLTTKASKN